MFYRVGDWDDLQIDRHVSLHDGFKIQLAGIVSAFLEFNGCSELDFHIWNANWPMKSEAKMAARGGQFCMSVSVPYAGLFVSFSFPRDFLHFLKIFLIVNTHKPCLQKVKMSLRI